MTEGRLIGARHTQARPTQARPTQARQDQAQQTRENLVAAGLRIAERAGLAGMTVNLIVVEAGVAKGTFFHHFRDRAAFLLTLHDEFHGRLCAEVTASIEGVPPGAGRLRVAANTYLDGCLRHRGVRALLLDARAEPLVGRAVATRSEQAVQLTEADFAAMGRPHPLDSARLWNGLLVEAALLELQSGHRRPALRSALEQFAGRDGPEDGPP